MWSVSNKHLFRQISHFFRENSNQTDENKEAEGQEKYERKYDEIQRFFLK